MLLPVAQWNFLISASLRLNSDKLSFTSSLCIFSWRVWYVSAHCTPCFNVSKHSKWFFIWFASLWCKFRLIQCRKKEEQKWRAIGGYSHALFCIIIPHSSVSPVLQKRSSMWGQISISQKLTTNLSLYLSSSYSVFLRVWGFVRKSMKLSANYLWWCCFIKVWEWVAILKAVGFI